MKMAPLKYAGFPRLKTKPQTAQRSCIEKIPVSTAPRPQCGQRKRSSVALRGAGGYSTRFLAPGSCGIPCKLVERRGGKGGGTCRKNYRATRTAYFPACGK